MLPVRKHVSNQRQERGFGLIVIAMCFTVLLGMLGMSVDLGHMFIVKNELQAFADASALAGCRWLDGTASGVRAANVIAASGPLGASKPNGYDFGTTRVESAAVTTLYAGAFAGPWVDYGTASAAAPNTYRFLKVSVSVRVPMYFLGVVGAGASQVVTSAAVAGEVPVSSPIGGLEPFILDAPDPASPSNYGFVSGQEYPLKAFVDLGQGNQESSLRSAIVYTDFPALPLVPGTTRLDGVSGNQGSIFSALAERSRQDTDQTSDTWLAYKQAFTGNGRRIITVPVGGSLAIGFANFFLGPASTIAGSSGPIHAAYIGPASFNGVAAPGGKGAQIHRVVLVQ
jgi:hypothetical protein